MDTVTISRKEYERLKALDDREEFVESVKRSLEDVREGRVTEL